jgi:hypothetical protein
VITTFRRFDNTQAADKTVRLLQAVARRRNGTGF